MAKVEGVCKDDEENISECFAADMATAKVERSRGRAGQEAAQGYVERETAFKHIRFWLENCKGITKINVTRYLPLLSAVGCCFPCCCC